MSEANPFDHEDIYKPDIVQYTDGSAVIQYAKTGASVHFGPDSEEKYAQFVGSSSGTNTAIVTTESGNQLAIGSGWVLNHNQRGYMKVPDVLPDVVIGEPWKLPGYESTPVTSVLLDYKSGAVNATRREDGENPFLAVRQAIQKVSDRYS